MKQSTTDGSSPPNTDDAPPICDYEGSSYRTDFWEGQGRDYEDLAERHALRKLLPDAGSRLLDIGAGFGRLADLYDGYGHVILLDYSVSQLQYARQHLGDSRFTYVAADLYQLPLANNAVDTTVMVRVLHHITDVARALFQIQRATRGSGTFVLEFANKRHALNIARRILGSDVDPFDHQPYAFAELHYDYHPAWVREQLQEAGFQPQRERAVSSFRIPALKRLIPARLLARMDAALQALTAPLAIAPSQFVRSRVAKSCASLAQHILACPRCGQSPLDESGSQVSCPACHAHWAIDQGVYVFKRELEGSS